MASHPRRVLAVANPAAGLRRRSDPGEAGVRALRAAGVACELRRTGAPGDARRIAAEAAAHGYELVIAVGGDGPAHEAANGLAGSRTALAVAPAGTMNLLARVLGLPLDAATAAEAVIAARRVRPVRPGRMGDALFLLMAGVGFDAWVLRELLSRVRGKIGFRDYALGALAALRSYPFPEIRLEVTGATIAAGAAVIGRAPLYGGFLRPTPGVSLERDELELCAFEARSALPLLRLAPLLWSGAHVARPGVVDRTVDRVRASSEFPDVPVQLVGEAAGGLPAEFALSDRVLLLAS